MNDKIIQWIFSGETGVSSMTMASALLGVKYPRNDKPYDIADFGRCVRLAREAKLTQQDLDRVAEIYPYWKPITDNWFDLQYDYYANHYDKIYEFLKTIKK